MAAKKSAVKPEPVQQGEQKIQEVTEAPTATTIKLKPETKGRLEILKGMLNIDDFDAVVCRLIDTLPAKLSTEEEIVLKMPASKYRWLMAHQDSCDCRNALNDAKV